MLRDNRKRGFTLVELLVVITIIGILIALLLPAVQAAREAARRLQCSNHVKQVALAMHSYHTANECLPAPGYYTDPGLTYDTIAKAHTWIESLLPYIEQQGLYDRLDFNVRMTEEPNPSVINGWTAATLMCPTDPDAGLFLNERITPDFLLPIGTSMGASYLPCAGPAALTPYTCEIPREEPINWNCIGSTTAAWGNNYSLAADNDGPGIFTMGRIARRFGEIKDGLSNTFLLGENLPAYAQMQMYFCSHFHVGSNNVPPNYHLLHPECLAAKEPPYFESPPCYRLMQGFKSEHPGGVTMAMADGSVQFVDENIEYYLWCIFGSRDSGLIKSAGSL